MIPVSYIHELFFVCVWPGLFFFEIKGEKNIDFSGITKPVVLIYKQGGQYKYRINYT